MRIVLTGPESSGKTALALALSQLYKGKMIPEYAREYLTSLTRDYTLSDIQIMFNEQFKKIDQIQFDEWCFEDTDILTYIIWEEVKYKFVDSNKVQSLMSHKADLYLYCEPDLPWRFDALRENEYDRIQIAKKYVNYCNALQLNYQIINGFGRKRLTKAIFFIEQYRKNLNFAT